MSLRAVPQPVGRFRSITTRDASGRERDGQAIVAWNSLSGGQIEVQFSDRAWMLCAPEELDAGRFTLDGCEPLSWPAAWFGASSAGSVSPVVARAVLVSLLEVTETPHTWETDKVCVVDGGPVLHPGEDGMYDLTVLGWKFIQTHDAY